MRTTHLANMAYDANAIEEVAPLIQRLRNLG